MRRILILAAVTALTVARPEVYKEKEDFKFSRSSSDEGSKSGYYGAQRGNVGGNYERAHNMDSLAQHQMSGLVNQVEGELGDGAKTKTGSVYTAANSRGVYGSGHYDASNLAGRNFQEGVSYGDSQSRSSSSQLSSGYNAAYANSRSQSHGGYQAAEQTGHSYQAADLQGLHNAQGATGAYDYNRQQSSSGHQSQSGYNSHTVYGSSDANSHSGNSDGSEIRTRLVSAVPVRIVFRPGTRVAIPIGAQTYDINQGSSVYDANQRSSSYDASQQSSSHDANERSSSYGLSSGNIEAEGLSGINRNNAYKPANDAKHYESSYSYRKEWERHNTIRPTLLIPTETPLPQNSELYEDSQARTSNHQYDHAGVASSSQNAHSSNAYSGYNANVKSSSSQSGYRSDLNSQHQASSGSNLNAYTQAGYNAGSNGDLNSQVESINSQKPKSYQSSYSYHKSWERQGDPYVIKPASNGYYDGQTPQRLSAGTKSASYGSSSHHQSQVDCDEICGHSRVARSYDAAQYQQELGQQSQNLEDFGQQSQHLEEFGQQSQNLEDFGQQSQNTLGKLEDLGQQSQQFDKLEDLGQQSQKFDKLEDLGQQSQKFDKLEDIGQQSQSTWDKYEDFGQQAQNKWDQQNDNRAQDLGQQTQHTPEQNAQDMWNKLEIQPQKDDQQALNKWHVMNTNNKQITQTLNQDIENIHVPLHNEWNQQESQFNHPDSLSQSPQNENDNKYNHRVETIWDKINTHTMQNGNSNAQTMQEHTSTDHLQNNNEGQVIQSTLGHNWNADTTSYTQNDTQEITTNNEAYSHNFQSHSQQNSALFNLWNKLDTIEKQLETSSNKSLDEKYNSSSEYTSSQNSYQTSRHEQTYYSEGRVNTTNSGQHHFAPSINRYDENNNKTIDFNHIQSSEDYVTVRPQDIGRGDIGPEDLSAQTGVTEKSPNVPNIDKNPISPVASGVININNQMNDKHNNNQRRSQSDNRNSSLVSNLPTSSNKNIQENANIQQQNIQDFDKQNENIQQQNTQDFGQLNENLEQKNVQDFGHQNENLDQQNLQDFTQLNENLDQQNVQDFGQQNENLEQQNLQDFGQQNENLDQQNLQNFSELNENLEQQNVQDFGQENENIEQQNLAAFGQQNETLEQQSLQGFEQQNENMEQQNVQGFEQLNENLEQQNIQDNGQQNENLEQQNLQSFEQLNKNLEQQNVQGFGQESDDFEQQNIPVFGQQNKTLEQQSLQGFEQQNENLEQQNVQGFELQSENVEQNIQDFVQQNENLEQQNLQGFEQHNVQHWSYSQQNLEQQNQQKPELQQQMFVQGRENYNQHGIQKLEKEISGNPEQQKSNNHEPLDNLGHVETDWRPHPEKIEVIPVEAPQNINSQSTPPKTPVIEPPPEPVTEKPGFWKSVGNKFVNAKDKVYSWFGS